jgi:hypothetical protein
MRAWTVGPTEVEVVERQPVRLGLRFRLRLGLAPPGGADGPVASSEVPGENRRWLRLGLGVGLAG